MPHSWSPPVLCIEVFLTYDILDPSRARSQMTVFHDRINFLLRSDPRESFDLANYSIKVLPNLDTLSVIGAGVKEKHDIYVFCTSGRSRNNCVTTMRLLGFCMLNEFGEHVLEKRMTTSNSLCDLPSMSTIWELE